MVSGRGVALSEELSPTYKISALFCGGVTTSTISLAVVHALKWVRGDEVVTPRDRSKYLAHALAIGVALGYAASKTVRGDLDYVSLRFLAGSSGACSWFLYKSFKSSSLFKGVVATSWLGYNIGFIYGKKRTRTAVNIEDVFFRLRLMVIRRNVQLYVQNSLAVADRSLGRERASSDPAVAVTV